MHTEYGQIDSDYVFVNLWAERGCPLTYAAVHKLVERLRVRTGIEFTPHMLRHTHATDLIRRVAWKSLPLADTRSSTTTSQT